MSPNTETNPEVGRELKASELKQDSVVVVTKAGRTAAITLWVRAVTDGSVFLHAGELGMTLILARCGPGNEQVEDDDHVPMKIFEYLGEV